MPRPGPAIATAWIVPVALVVLGLGLPGCATRTRAQLISEPGCADVAIPIYFAEQSAEVSRAARRVITDTAAQARRCTVAAVDVMGLADYRGPADANLALSRRRAEAVAGALVKAGLPAPQFRLAADGESGALTASGQVEPLRRRADILIRYRR